MTDISNTNNSSSSLTAGQAIAVESHETVLSPEIRKAMDIIFPKSTVQLLQGGCPLADDTCLNTEGCYGNVHSETTSAESVVNDSVLTSCAPSGNVTTLNTINTLMVTSTDVLTNANRNECPAGLSIDSVAGVIASSNNQDITNTVIVTSTDVLTNANRNECPAGLSIDSVAGVIANSNNQDITNTVMVTSTDVLTNANRNECPTGLLLPSSTDSVAGAIANSNNQDITNTVMVTSTDVLTKANRNESPTGLLLPSSTDSVAGAVADSSNQDITNTVMVTSTDVLTNANRNECPTGLLLPSSTDSVAGAVADSSNQDITNTVMITSTDVLTNANRNECPTGLLLSSSTDSVAGAVADSNNQDITNTVMVMSTDVLTNPNGNEFPAGLSTDSVAGTIANSNNQDITNTVIVTSTDVLTNANINECPTGLLLSSSTDSVAGAVANSNNQDITNTVMITSTDVLTNANGNKSPAGLSTVSVAGAVANSNNQDITNIVMVTSTDDLTNANGSESSAGLSTDSVAGAVANSNNQDITNTDIEPENTSLESAKQTGVKATIAKADLEIVSPCDVFNDESLEKTSRRLHSADLSSSECNSRGDSDSEDMRRPFAGIAREKKKQKKKKKKDNGSVKLSNSSEINENISTELKSASESCIQNDTSAVYASNSNSPLSLTDFNCDPKLPEKNADRESFLNDNAINKCTARLNNKDSDSQSWILENGYVGSEHFDKNTDMMTEEISNISFSSTKENKNRSRSKQHLPIIKTHRFNIVKQRKKILNTFPPCFIVVKKLQMHNFKKNYSHAESVLPLSTRLKLLSDLCDQGLVKCKKTRVEDGDELIYRNIFEETILTETADGYVNSSRGRSLRKRDKKISYVEPSEDDILDEYSRKRNRSKHKDAAVRSDDESTAENKKRKKHVSLSESKTDTLNTVTSKAVTSLTVASPQDSSDRRKAIKDTGNSNESSKTKSNSYKAKVNGKGKEKTNEIIVYPPACVGSRNVYYAKGGATAKTSVSYSTLQAKQTPVISAIQVSPPSTNITILPTTTISGAFMHHANPVSLFTSLPLSIPVSLPTQNLIAGAPLPTQMSTAGGLKKPPPQYCVVKMDGKDVLLQIVSSGGIGTAVPVVVPKGKTLFTPSVPLVTGSPHLFPFHQRASTPSYTQAMPVPLTSVVAVSQGNAPPTAPLQPLMGIQVISRPITTSSQNISVSALPVIQTAQLTSLTSTASVRPIHLSSPRQQSPAAGLITPITVLSASNSGASVTSVASTTRSIPALPSAVTPMPAPNTTTVVRAVRVPTPNLRAIVPNQATSLRSFRIFVPGCSATGMPSRFATLGTIANSSPLTHLAASSMLLPQRKRSSDQEMTPEMRAAKRRRLEKKYPLPPGVVIKTEPLDAPPKSSPMITTVSGSRSLLSQNLHLLSASRPGTNFQSIRIIGPPLANSLSARNIRGNSNIIYRATSIGGGQTILLPTSLGQISTRTTTTVTSVSVNSFPSLTTSSLDHTVTGDNTATNAANASDSSVSSSSFRAVSEINPSSPVPQFTENAATAVLASISSNAAELLEMDTSSTSSVISSSEPVLTTNTINASSVSLLSAGMESLHNSATSTVADNLRSVTSSPSLASAKGPGETSAMEIMRNGLEELKKFIEVQVVCGLKGDRLEKLKELLRRKEEQYKDMLQLADEGESLLPASQTNGDIGGGEESDVALNGPGGTETDPFVID